MTTTTALPPATDFDAMFAAADDPWEFRSRWYEQRKRALTLACLPDAFYASAIEPGCANGELSAALATRCGHLLACDGSAGAVRVARQRLAEFPHVQVRQALVPADWPALDSAEPPGFDLIVISELAYYLDAGAVTELAIRARASLRPGGTLLACHWRRQIPGCALVGDEVHALLQQALGWPPLMQVLDADLRLDVWRDGGSSVADAEGLT